MLGEEQLFAMFQEEEDSDDEVDKAKADNADDDSYDINAGAPAAKPGPTPSLQLS